MSFDEQPILGVEPLVQRALRASFAPRVLDLWIEGVEPALSVRQVSIREQISDLFSIAIIARSPRPDLDLEAMLFQPSSLTLTHHGFRTYTGLCAGAVVVFGGAPCDAMPRSGPPLPCVDHPNEAAEREFVTRVRVTHEGRTGAVTLRDVDFRHPALALAAQAAQPEGLLEHYRYTPG